MPSSPAKKRLTSLAALALLFVFAPNPGQAEEALRDPTRPYSPVHGTRTSSPRFVVNAIIISPERRVAIVNGRRVAVGGSLGDATVIAIDKDELVLEIDGKRITAGLNKGAMRR